jgi:hypothetical protein
MEQQQQQQQPAGPSVKLTRPPEGTPPIYAQDSKGDEAVVHAHYFIGGCDWLVTEYDREDDIAFGWACTGDRQNAELGYTNLGELERIRVRGLFAVDYDEHWKPVSLREAIAEIDRRHGA